MGWWTQAIVMLAYLGILDFGVSIVFPMEIAKQTGCRLDTPHPSNLSAITANWLKLSLFQTPLVLLCAAMGVYLLTISRDRFMMESILLFVCSSLLFPLRLGPLILNGLQEHKYGGFVQLFSLLSGIIATIGFAVIQLGGLSLVCGWLVQSLVSQILTWQRLLTKHREWIPKLSEISGARVRLTDLTIGFWAWLSAIGVVFGTSAEIMALDFNHYSASIFSYASTTKILTVIFPLAISFGIALIPGLTELRSTNDRIGAQRVAVVYAQALMLFSGLIGCLTLTFNELFVSLWVSKVYYLGDSLTLFSLIAMNMRHLLSSIGIALFSCHQEVSLWRLTFFDGCLSLGITYFLTRFGGIAWTPIGPVVSIALTLGIAAWLLFNADRNLFSQMMQSASILMLIYLVLLFLCYSVLKPTETQSIYFSIANALMIPFFYFGIMFVATRRFKLWELLGSYWIKLLPV